MIERARVSSYGRNTPRSWWIRIPGRAFARVAGACVPDCPAAKFGTGFDPREIVLKVRYGLAGELLVERSVLWQCFKCYRCYQSCPQPVKPVEMFAWLRKLLPEVVHGAAAAVDDSEDPDAAAPPTK